MRLLIVLLFVTLPLAASARDHERTTCSGTPSRNASLLTDGEHEAVIDEHPNGDPVLVEAIAQERTRYPDPPLMWTALTNVTWDQARKIILLGAVHVLWEHLDLSVVLVTRSGHRYRSTEPALGEAEHVLGVVDPCHVYTMVVLE